MADKPEIDTDDVKARRGKAKHAPAIDLPAADVTEIRPDAASEPASGTEAAGMTGAESVAADPPVHEASPPAAPKPRTPMLVPALLGLVAGAIGGFGVTQFAGRTAPVAPDSGLVTRLGALEQKITSTRPAEPAAVSVPPAVLDRLAKAEAALEGAGRREAALNEALGALRQDIAREAEARSKAVAAVGQQVPVAPVAPSVPPAEIEGLKSRIGSVEEAARNAAALAPKVEAIQPRIETVSRDVQALAARLGGIAQREGLGAANARMAAVALVEDAVAAGRPLGRPLQVLKDLGTAEPALAPLMPFAEAPVPDARVLLAELNAIRLPSAAPASGEAPSLLERMKRGALSLVEVRRTGEITGTDDAAHVARAAQALGRGDIATAITLTGRLSPAAAPAYAEWRRRAEARIRAGAAVGALRTEALEALAAAVQPASK